MNKPTKRINQTVLIADASDTNRAVLSGILKDEFEIIEASDALGAASVLNKQTNCVSLVLLDMDIPPHGGFELLQMMNDSRMIDNIPVIMISYHKDNSHIETAYSLGVTDYITFPFDPLIIRRRVTNTINLYSRQKKLIGLVVDQIYEKEKINNLMISILSHIVEFRNVESGSHVLQVQSVTEILLLCLTQITDKYNLSDTDITLIINAAALHDIGKITIPEKIINKPGPLTREEFEIIKTHSSAGAAMIESLLDYRDEPFVKVAYEICRWHHERYDGGGYPDGLRGDEIPISAQIVSLADVYDALVSERVYKRAYTHDTAINMILSGECGVFNPLLLKCLKASDCLIKNKLIETPFNHFSEKDFKRLTEEMVLRNELSASKLTMQLLKHELMMNNLAINPETDD